MNMNHYDLELRTESLINQLILHEVVEFKESNKSNENKDTKIKFVKGMGFIIAHNCIRKQNISDSKHDIMEESD